PTSAGTAAFPNSGVGVQTDEGAANNLIGGSTPGTGNLLSGNTTGILIAGGNNTVQGNGIGTNASNTGSIPNGIGIQIGSGVPDITIGGTISGAPGTGPGNIVRGNLTTGIQVAGPRYVIQGNSIIQNGTYGVALLDGACPGLIGTGSKPNVCPNLLLTDVSPDDPSDVA